MVVSNIIGALTGPPQQFISGDGPYFGAVFPQYYIFPVYGWFGVEDIAEQNIILIATLDPLPSESGLAKAGGGSYMRQN